MIKIRLSVVVSELTRGTGKYRNILDGRGVSGLLNFSRVLFTMLSLIIFGKYNPIYTDAGEITALNEIWEGAKNSYTSADEVVVRIDFKSSRTSKGGVDGRIVTNTTIISSIVSDTLGVGVLPVTV